MENADEKQPTDLAGRVENAERAKIASEQAAFKQKVGMGMSESLAAAECQAARVQAPGTARVTLESMHARVVSSEFLHPESCKHMTIAVLTLDNGFTLVGRSAPADPANFNEAYGIQLAHADAIRQLWQLEGYLLCERLWQAKRV